MRRPRARFLFGMAVGVGFSLSISAGLIVTAAAFAALILLGLALRSLAVLSGGLTGFGLAWLVLFYIAFGKTLCNGPGCGDGGQYVPFILLGAAIVVAGIFFGVIGSFRSIRRDHA